MILIACGVDLFLLGRECPSVSSRHRRPSWLLTSSELLTNSPVWVLIPSSPCRQLRNHLLQHSLCLDSRQQVVCQEHWSCMWSICSRVWTCPGDLSENSPPHGSSQPYAISWRWISVAWGCCASWMPKSLTEVLGWTPVCIRQISRDHRRVGYPPVYWGPHHIDRINPCHRSSAVSLGVIRALKVVKAAFKFLTEDAPYAAVTSDRFYFFAFWIRFSNWAVIAVYWLQYTAVSVTDAAPFHNKDVWHTCTKWTMESCNFQLKQHWSVCQSRPCGTHNICSLSSARFSTSRYSSSPVNTGQRKRNLPQSPSNSTACNIWYATRRSFLGLIPYSLPMFKCD